MFEGGDDTCLHRLPEGREMFYLRKPVSGYFLRINSEKYAMGFPIKK
jgi:hypothetical protein